MIGTIAALRIAADGRELVEFVAEHRRNEFDTRQFSDRKFAFELSVAKHGNSVAHFVYLFEKVRNEHDTRSLRF